MIEKPRFKAHLRPYVIGDEGVLLLSETRPCVLEGRMFEVVAPWLDGRATTEEIIAGVESQLSPAEVYYALTLLERQGLIVEAGDDLPFTDEEAAFLEIQNIDLRTAARRLRETTLTVAVLGDIEVEPFHALLSSMHVRVGESAPLAVVLTDDYLRDELAEYNRASLQLGRPWLLARPFGREIWIGPLFKPGAGACWACLAHRLRINRAADIFARHLTDADAHGRLVRTATGATLHAAFALAAGKVAEWITRGELPEFEGAVVSFDTLTWQSQRHTLVKQVYCHACGERSTDFTEPPRPLVLESRKKDAMRDGGHRAVAPEETLAKYSHLISPITGVLSDLKSRSEASGDVIHVYVAGDNKAARHDSLRSLQTNLRSKSAGKGTTDAQAKAGALCEAVERYSGYFQGSEPRLKGRLADMRGLAIHPNDCMLFSEKQYAERDVWNARKSQFNFVPTRFDVEAEVEWTPVWSMTGQRFRYLPTAFCYYSYPLPPDNSYCRACSNGSAAGNTLEEAVLQGFLELVERDCVALWWYNRVTRPAVCLDSFAEPFLKRQRDFLHARGRDLWALDLTNDLGIPVFAAFSRRLGGVDEECLMMGFGAHLDPRTALLRAATELNQMLSWVLPHEGKGALQERIRDPETLHWIKTATLANQPHLAPSEKNPARHARDFTQLATDDLLDDVLYCQTLVERHGLELLLLDQTRQDTGMPVVKVIVPGLRHFHARFAPGRLYDVPVRLGWLPSPLTEEQLNPIPMFL